MAPAVSSRYIGSGDEFLERSGQKIAKDYERERGNLHRNESSTRIAGWVARLDDVWFVGACCIRLDDSVEKVFQPDHID